MIRDPNQETYIYVLESTEGNLYVGMTYNLQKRLKQHNGGKTIATKGKVWSLVHFYTCQDRIIASKLERYLHRLDINELLDVLQVSPEFGDMLLKEVRSISDSKVEAEMRSLLAGAVWPERSALPYGCDR